jgi:hypothetical protein
LLKLYTYQSIKECAMRNLVRIEGMGAKGHIGEYVAREAGAATGAVCYQFLATLWIAFDSGRQRLHPSRW